MNYVITWDPYATDGGKGVVEELSHALLRITGSNQDLRSLAVDDFTCGIIETGGFPPEVMKIALRHVKGWNPRGVVVAYADDADAYPGFRVLDGWATGEARLTSATCCVRKGARS